MAHLLVFFRQICPPIVEAKMIARITQQIMIMIFFCLSRQGKKKREERRHCREGFQREAGRDGPGCERGVKGARKMDLASRTQDAQRHITSP